MTRDMHLQERVTEVLGALWRVDTSKIRVRASDDGIVVLEGWVFLEHDRKAVEAAARGVAGATAVVSGVSVDPERGGSDPFPDPDVDWNPFPRA